MFHKHILLSPLWIALLSQSVSHTCNCHRCSSWDIIELYPEWDQLLFYSVNSLLLIVGFFFFYLLEEDRKSAGKEKKTKAKVTTPPTPSSGGPSSPVKTPSKARRFQPNLSPVNRTPTNPNLLERDPSWSMPEADQLPWHQKQLYQVLGKGADYFLHPKIEKKAVKPVNSKLRKEGGGSLMMSSFF